MELKLRNALNFSMISRSRGFLASLFVVLFMVIGSQVNAQTIAVTGVATTPVCAGSTVTVTFTATSGNPAGSRFTNATSFTAYLSAVGGGAPYSSIATFTNATLPATGVNGAVYTGLTQVVTIPSGTAAGAVYKISIGSTSPTFNGSAGAGQSASFTVNVSPTGGSVAGSATVCSGGSNSTTLTLSGHSGSVLLEFRQLQILLLLIQQPI